MPHPLSKQYQKQQRVKAKRLARHANSGCLMALLMPLLAVWALLGGRR